MNRYYLRLLLCCISAVVLVTGCAITGNGRGDKKEVSGLAPGSEQVYYDVYAIGGDDWAEDWSPQLHRSELHLFEPGMAINQPASSPVSSDGIGITVPGGPRTGRGFRVQLANVLEEQQAMEIKSRAEKIFDRVYIIFRSPNYKVRMGNFITRQSADAAADSSLAAGFRDAWVVPSKIELFPMEAPRDTL